MMTSRASQELRATEEWELLFDFLVPTLAQIEEKV